MGWMDTGLEAKFGNPSTGIDQILVKKGIVNPSAMAQAFIHDILNVVGGKG